LTAHDTIPTKNGRQWHLRRRRGPEACIFRAIIVRLMARHKVQRDVEATKPPSGV
jgi:hypothetical protein